MIMTMRLRVSNRYQYH